MTAPMAFRATYADWKLIKTRGVVQVVMEVPLADSDAAYDVLGGMPNSAHENWFAIAPLTIPPAAKEKSKPVESIPAKPSLANDKPSGKAKLDWRQVQPAAQAGIRCGEPVFIAFLREKYGDDFEAMESDAAATVRYLCGVNSRAELGTKHAARVIWHQLDSEFEAWKALERV